MILSLVVILFSQIEFSSSSKPLIPPRQAAVSSGGGSSVLVVSVEFTNQGENFSMKPTRMKFEFKENLYALQLQRVKSDNVIFVVMSLDKTKPDDLSANIVEDRFELEARGVKRIDLDGDGSMDILVSLNSVNLILPNSRNVRPESASFSVKLIEEDD